MKRRKDSRRSSSPPRQRLGQWLLIVGVVCLPALAVAFEAKENFRLPKLLLAESLGLASLLFLTWRGRHRAVDWRRLARSPAILAVTPFLAVASVGWLVSSHPHHVLQGLVSLWIGAACLVGWSLALTAAEHRRLFATLSIPAAILSLVAIGQFHHLFEPFKFQANVQDRIAITSLAGGAFDLAGFLVLPMLFAQLELFRASRPRGRWWWVLTMALGVYTLALTQTLTAIAALLVASLVLWLGLLPWRRVVAVTAMLAVVAGGLVLAVGPLRERVVAKTGDLTSGEINDLLSGRLDGWWAALWMFEERPVAGVGHGAYRAEFGNARLALFDEGYRFYRRQHQTYFSNAHSEPLEVLAEMGVPGFLALVWAVIMAIRQMRRRSTSSARQAPEEPDGADTFEHDERAFLWAGLAGLAVLSLANFPMRVALVAYPYLFLLSRVFSQGVDEAPKAEKGAKAAKSDDRASAGHRLAWVVMPLLVVILVIHLQDARGRLKANHQIWQVEQLTVQLAQQGVLSLRPMPAQARRLLESQASGLLQASEDDPVEVRIPLSRGSLFYLLGRHDAAVRAYETALTLEPRSEIYANLGRVHFAAGDREAARDAFRKAQRLNRNIARNYRGYFERLGLRQPRERDSGEE